MENFVRDLRASPHASQRSDIGIPQTLAKVIFPTIWKCGQLRCATNMFLVLGIHSVQIDNVRNRQAALLPLFKIDGVARADFSFAKYSEVKSGALALEEALDHLHSVKPNA